MRASALLFAGLVGGAGCGGGDDTKPAIERYAPRFAELLCENLGPCCAANGLSFDHDSCVLGGAGYVQSGVDRAKAAGATFDEAAANACLAAVKSLTRSCRAIAEDPPSAAACARVFTGVKPPGQACTSDLDCASGPEGRGACYVLSSDAAGHVSGVCVLHPSPALEGDVCGVTSGSPPRVLADCQQSGLQCSVTSQTCVPRVALGGSCGGFVRCDDGLFCDATGRCATAFPPGTACTKNEECATGGCIRSKCGDNSVGGAMPCTGAP